MPRYSSDTLSNDEAPYQQSRATLRRRFGNRAIRSFGPDSGDRPGDPSTRTKMGFTDEGTWRDFFTPSVKPTLAAPMREPQRAPVTFYDETTPFGRPEAGTTRSGTNFVSRFGYGGVRSAADVKAGRNEPRDMRAFDAQMKSPATEGQLAMLNSPPATAQPPTSMNLLPAPRSGSPITSMRPSEFSPTPSADGYYDSILNAAPRRLSIGTGVLDRIGKVSTWDEPI